MNEIEPGMQASLRAPSRKPWLWLVLIAVVMAVGLCRCIRCKSKERGSIIAPASVVQTQAVERAALAGTNKPHAQPTPSPSESKPAPVPAPVPAATNARPGTNSIAATSPAPPKTNDVTSLLAEAKAMEDKGDLVLARGKWREVLGQTADPRQVSSAEERIGTINVELVLTPRAMPEKVEYVVQSGDLVKNIAKKLGTTIDLLQEGNQLKTPDLIRAGDRLLVVTGKFSIVVSKARNDLVLRLNNEFFKRYRVGTGKYSKTPSGAYAIAVKMKEPPWSRPDGKEIPYGDKENILGTRWMSIRATGATPDIKGYGIHGTWDDTSIGKAESAGCIRMKNSDVEEVYKFVPVNTPVTITE